MTVRELLKKIQSWRGLPGETLVEVFERVAEQFHKDTGYLRPGKDCRLVDREIRVEAWETWTREKNDELDEEIAFAIATMEHRDAVDIEIVRAAVDEKPLPSWLQMYKKLEAIEKVLASDSQDALVLAKIATLMK